MFTIVTSFLRTAVEKRNWLYSKVYILPLGAFLTAHSVSYLFAPSLGAHTAFISLRSSESYTNLSNSTA